ncbi:MAG: hypothetical protein M3P49_00765 [Actinomycetota bacterium]|nr:hypothetical protein [Actinomycetota bacterium]
MAKRKGKEREVEVVPLTIPTTRPKESPKETPAPAPARPRRKREIVPV